MGDPKTLKLVSWVLLGIGVIMLVGGLIYDSRNDGSDEVNLTGLYFGATAVCLLAVIAGQRAKKLDR